MCFFPAAGMQVPSPRLPDFVILTEERDIDRRSRMMLEWSDRATVRAGIVVVRLVAADLGHSVVVEDGVGEGGCPGVEPDMVEVTHTVLGAVEAG